MAFQGRTNARFCETHWSLVHVAARAGEPGAEEAIHALCASYVYPIYAYLRRHGHHPHAAEDLTQGFFSDLLRRDWLGGVGSEKGRFRTFLLACLRNYLLKDVVRNAGPTRNPGEPILSFDAAQAESSYNLEPQDVRDPAVLFERRIALTLISAALDKLKNEYAAEGKAHLFDTLSSRLIGEAEWGTGAQDAANLGMTHGAMRAALARMRQRCRELLRAEVARTVEDPTIVDDEIRFLMGICR